MADGPGHALPQRTGRGGQPADARTTHRGRDGRRGTHLQVGPTGFDLEIWMIMTTMISLGIAHRVTILECSVNLPGQ